MSDAWDSRWWLGEVASDPTFSDEIVPLLLELVGPEPVTWLDLGCGEGQGMRAVTVAGSQVIGCDLDSMLLGHAAAAGPVVQCRLPDLAWLGDRTVGGAFAVLVLEHIEDHERLLAEAARVVAADGALVIVANHPAFTAPGAGPLIDPGDGEVTWRWGAYLQSGTSVEPAGSFNLMMYHRPLGQLLTAAAAAGWALDRLLERGPGPAAADRDPLLAAQRHIPRLLGLRFHNAGHP